MLRYCKIYLPTNQISAIEDNYLRYNVKIIKKREMRIKRLPFSKFVDEKN